MRFISHVTMKRNKTFYLWQLLLCKLCALNGVVGVAAAVYFRVRNVLGQELLGVGII